MMKYLWPVLALTTLAGCGDNATTRPDNLLAGNDFEGLEGWTNEVPMPALTRDKAHSGVYSVRVGPGVDYSNGFIGTLGKLSATKPTQIQVKGWAYVPTGPTGAALVTQLMDPAAPKPVVWESLALDKLVKKRNEWTEVEKTITVPANANPNFKLYVYLWSGGQPNVAYLDDVQILRAK